MLREVQAPVAVPTEDPKKKSECYGVFCLTYDLKAVSFLLCIVLQDIDFIYVCYNLHVGNMM